MYLISPNFPQTLSFPSLEPGEIGTLRAGSSLCDIELLAAIPVMPGCPELDPRLTVPDAVNGIYTNGRDWYQIAFRSF